MVRKVPVPKIPPMPSARSGRVAARSRLAPLAAAPSTGCGETELPDLLGAFCGDRADDPNAQTPLPAAAVVRPPNLKGR